MRSDIKAEARKLVTRTTAAQGLPEKITDPATIERVAALLSNRDGTTVAKKAS
jgi:hypothetical protein